MLTNRLRDQRRADRAEVTMTADLRNSVHPYHPVEIEDLSVFGVRLSTWAKHDPADRALIRLPTLGGIPARLVWSQDQHFGFRFETPLHPAVFDMLCQRHAIRSLPDA